MNPFGILIFSVKFKKHAWLILELSAKASGTIEDAVPICKLYIVGSTTL